MAVVSVMQAASVVRQNFYSFLPATTIAYPIAFLFISGNGQVPVESVQTRDTESLPRMYSR